MQVFVGELAPVGIVGHDFEPVVLLAVFGLEVHAVHPSRLEDNVELLVWENHLLGELERCVRYAVEGLGHLVAFLVVALAFVGSERFDKAFHLGVDIFHDNYRLDSILLGRCGCLNVAFGRVFLGEHEPALHHAVRHDVGAGGFAIVGRKVTFGAEHDKSVGVYSLTSLRAHLLDGIVHFEYYCVSSHLTATHADDVVLHPPLTPEGFGNAVQC